MLGMTWDFRGPILMGDTIKVRQIVESKRGQVALESQEGAGATFRFTWPKAEQEVVKSA